MTRKYFTEPEQNVYVEATPEQIREAKTQIFLNELKGDVLSCPHTVWYDEHSFIYTERTCLACDTVFELI